MLFSCSNYTKEQTGFTGCCLLFKLLEAYRLHLGCCFLLKLIGGRQASQDAVCWSDQTEARQASSDAVFAPKQRQKSFTGCWLFAVQTIRRQTGLLLVCLNNMSNSFHMVLFNCLKSIKTVSRRCLKKRESARVSESESLARHRILRSVQDCTLRGIRNLCLATRWILVHLLNLSCPLIDPTSDPLHPRGLLLKNILLSYSNPLLFLPGMSLNVFPIEALTDELMEAVAL
jgi:hypothetical protein